MGQLALAAGEKKPFPFTLLTGLGTALVVIEAAALDRSAVATPFLTGFWTGSSDSGSAARHSSRFSLSEAAGVFTHKLEAEPQGRQISLVGHAFRISGGKGNVVLTNGSNAGHTITVNFIDGVEPLKDTHTEYYTTASRAGGTIFNQGVTIPDFAKRYRIRTQSNGILANGILGSSYIPRVTQKALNDSAIRMNVDEEGTWFELLPHAIYLLIDTTDLLAATPFEIEWETYK